MGWWVLGELETQVFYKHWHALSLSSPSLLSTSSREAQLQPGVCSHLPSHSCGSFSFQPLRQSPAADPLLLSSRTPDPLTPDQSFSTLYWESENPISTLVKLKSQSQEQSPWVWILSAPNRELFLELLEAAEMIHVKALCKNSHGGTGGGSPKFSAFLVLSSYHLGALFGSTSQSHTRHQQSHI